MVIFLIISKIIFLDYESVFWQCISTFLYLYYFNYATWKKYVAILQIYLVILFAPRLTIMILRIPERYYQHAFDLSTSAFSHL